MVCIFLGFAYRKSMGFSINRLCIKYHLYLQLDNLTMSNDTDEKTKKQNKIFEFEKVETGQPIHIEDALITLFYRHLINGNALR